MAPDRADLHALLRRAQSRTSSRAGDVKLAHVRPLGAADWTALAAFGRAWRGNGHGADPGARLRIRWHDGSPSARRSSDLEAVIPPQVLHRTVSEVQLVDVDTDALVPKIAAYWIAFAPHLELTYEAGPGARAAEFQRALVSQGGTRVGTTR